MGNPIPKGKGQFIRENVAAHCKVMGHYGELWKKGSADQNDMVMHIELMIWVKVIHYIREFSGNVIALFFPHTPKLFSFLFPVISRFTKHNEAVVLILTYDTCYFDIIDI